MKGLLLVALLAAFVLSASCQEVQSEVSFLEANADAAEALKASTSAKPALDTRAPGLGEFRQFDSGLQQKIGYLQRRIAAATRRHGWQHDRLRAAVRSQFAAWRSKLRWFKRKFNHLKLTARRRLFRQRALYRRRVWEVKKEMESMQFASPAARQAWLASKIGEVKLGLQRKTVWLKKRHAIARHLLWQRYLLARKRFLARVQSLHTKLRFQMDSHAAEIRRYKDKIAIMRRFQIMNGRFHNNWKKKYFRQLRKWKALKLNYEQRLARRKAFVESMKKKFGVWKQNAKAKHKAAVVALNDKWKKINEGRHRAFVANVKDQKEWLAKQTQALKQQAKMKFIALKAKLKRKHQVEVAALMLRMHKSKLWKKHREAQIRALVKRLKAQYKRRVARLNWFTASMHKRKAQLTANRKARWTRFKAKWKARLARARKGCALRYKRARKILAARKREVVARWKAWQANAGRASNARLQQLRAVHAKALADAKKSRDAAKAAYAARLAKEQRDENTQQVSFKNKLRMMMEEEAPEGLNDAEKREWTAVRDKHVADLKASYAAAKHKRETERGQRHIQLKAELARRDAAIAKSQQEQQKYVEAQMKKENDVQAKRAARLLARKRAFGLWLRQQRTKVKARFQACNAKVKSLLDSFKKAKDSFMAREKKLMAAERAWWAKNYKTYVQRLEYLKGRREQYRKSIGELRAKFRAEAQARREQYQKLQQEHKERLAKLAAEKQEDRKKAAAEQEAQQKRLAEAAQAAKLVQDARREQATLDQRHAKESAADAAKAREVAAKKKAAAQLLESAKAKAAQSQAAHDQAQAQRIAQHLHQLEQQEKALIGREASRVAERDAARKKREEAEKLQEQQRARHAAAALKAKAAREARLVAEKLRAEQMQLAEQQKQRALAIEAKRRREEEVRWQQKQAALEKRFQDQFRAKEIAMKAYWKQHNAQTRAARYKAKVEALHKKDVRKKQREQARQKARQEKELRRQARIKRRKLRHERKTKKHRRWLKRIRAWKRARRIEAQAHHKQWLEQREKQRQERNAARLARRQARELRQAQRRREAEQRKEQLRLRHMEHRRRVQALRKGRMLLRRLRMKLAGQRAVLHDLLADKLVLYDTIRRNDTAEVREKLSNLEVEIDATKANMTNLLRSIHTLVNITTNHTAAVIDLVGQIKALQTQSEAADRAAAGDRTEEEADAKQEALDAATKQLDAVTTALDLKQREEDAAKAKAAKEEKEAEAKMKQAELQHIKQLAVDRARQIAKMHYKKHMHVHLRKLKKLLVAKGQQLRKALASKAKAEVAARKKQLEDQYRDRRRQLKQFLRTRARRWLTRSLVDFDHLRRVFKSWRDFASRWTRSYERQCTITNLTNDERIQCEKAKARFTEFEAKARSLMKKHHNSTFNRIRRRLAFAFNPKHFNQDRKEELEHKKHAEAMRKKLRELYERAMATRDGAERQHILARLRRERLQQFFNSRKAKWTAIFDAGQDRRRKQWEAENPNSNNPVPPTLSVIQGAQSNTTVPAIPPQ